ncbi:MAG: hypothetical protein ACKVZJ_02885 [Phycisphaerales bacterium]
MRHDLYPCPRAIRPAAPASRLAAAVLVACAAGALDASEAHAAQLHSNGGFITNPTGGTGTIAGLPISNADGFTFPGVQGTFVTTGINATVAINTAVAEDFVVTNGGWKIDALTVYAFQTSQTAPSVTRVHVNLWTETPYSAGSPGAPPVIPTPVFTDDLVIDVAPGQFVAHRQGTTGTSTVRPVFRYTVPVPQIAALGFLPEGRYWIEWSFVGADLPSRNVFTPLISPRTSVINHNARLFNSIDGTAGGPRVWFEGREGFVAGVTEGRAYELPFELTGSLIPAPSNAGLLMLATALAARRRRRATDLSSGQC